MVIVKVEIGNTLGSQCCQESVINWMSVLKEDDSQDCNENEWMYGVARYTQERYEDQELISGTLKCENLAR